MTSGMVRSSWQRGVEIGATGIAGSLRGQPRYDVRDLLVRDRPAGHVSAPARRAEIGAAADDDGPQPLVADEREEGVVRDRAALRRALAAGAVAGCAEDSVGLLASMRVAGS